jgi:hypothetical protein
VCSAARWPDAAGASRGAFAATQWRASSTGARSSRSWPRSPARSSQPPACRTLDQLCCSAAHSNPHLYRLVVVHCQHLVVLRLPLAPATATQYASSSLRTCVFRSQHSLLLDSPMLAVANRAIPSPVHYPPDGKSLSIRNLVVPTIIGTPCSFVFGSSQKSPFRFFLSSSPSSLQCVHERNCMGATNETDGTTRRRTIASTYKRLVVDAPVFSHYYCVGWLEGVYRQEDRTRILSLRGNQRNAVDQARPRKGRQRRA